MKAISYQLFIEVTTDLTLEVGALGMLQFPAGHYVYTGSAKNNPEARIQRHLSKTKRLRWHIDYLLIRPEVHIYRVEQSSLPECELNQQTPGRIVQSGFGASDCRAGCKAHLKYIDSSM
ncbi:GIY-YIG nuclease family protein [candidate division KSB1 bacterium]|nr:GIY-YIG nuclease family protein [candidate division KSB1 bacterium]